MFDPLVVEVVGGAPSRQVRIAGGWKCGDYGHRGRRAWQRTFDTWIRSFVGLQSGRRRIASSLGLLLLATLLPAPCRSGLDGRNARRGRWFGAHGRHGATGGRGVGADRAFCSSSTLRRGFHGTAAARRSLFGYRILIRQPRSLLDDACNINAPRAKTIQGNTIHPDLLEARRIHIPLLPRTLSFSIRPPLLPVLVIFRDRQIQPR
mmetsp:Transcript_16505/g.29851  ORF Transcript_16505/g.29851 Transcript_16505/m.29851 type:complete len:206 (+) Transcript_16505:1363-1980(+)